MNNVLLKLRLAYNRWYLDQLKYSTMRMGGNNINLLIEQKNIINELEKLVNENNKSKGRNNKH